MKPGTVFFASLSAALICHSSAVPITQGQDVRFEDAIISPVDGYELQAFGNSVDIDGEVAIVGARDDDENGTDAGAAYVFRFDGEAWQQEAKLLASDGEPHDIFGNSVAISRDIAVVGAYGDDDLDDQSGAVYVFRYDNEAWIEEQKIHPSNSTERLHFGTAVDVDSDRILVGADNQPGRGSAYVFVYDLVEQWVEQQKLTTEDLTAGHHFGFRVALSGDVALATERFDNDRGERSGSVHVFRFDGIVWNYDEKLLAPDGDENDEFGWSVAVDSDVAAIGVRNDDDVAEDSGAAYVFRYVESAWTPEQKLTAWDGTAFDHFGSSVAVNGHTMVVGASFAEGQEDVSGAAYAFRKVRAQWREQEKLISSDGARGDGFGLDLAASADRSIIASPYSDDIGEAFGAAYVFNLGYTTGCLNLVAENLVAGERAVFDVSQGLPGEVVALLWSTTAGEYVANTGDWCVNFDFDLPSGNPASHVVFTGRLDTAGEIVRRVRIPNKARGLEIALQAALKNTCPDTCMSNMVEAIVE